MRAQAKYLTNYMTSMWFGDFISKPLQPINHCHEQVFTEGFTLSSHMGLSSQYLYSYYTKRKAKKKKNEQIE